MNGQALVDGELERWQCELVEWLALCEFAEWKARFNGAEVDKKWVERMTSAYYGRYSAREAIEIEFST